MNWFLQNHKYRAKLTNGGKLLNKARFWLPNVEGVYSLRKKKPPAFTSGHQAK